MQISKLQYITTHAVHAEKACKGGATWIQLRVKDESEEDWLAMALATKIICKKYGAILIINDNVAIAKAMQADGVHLGKEDMPPEEARKILGDNYIIGGTANTLEDIKSLSAQKADYIGLGPFRFTTTKTNLSPVLGLDGYRTIIKQMQSEQIHLPIIAIGGIELPDVREILQTGVYGIAVSSAISNSGNIESAAREFMQRIKNEMNYEKRSA
jgi:thiamine-phosphate pyrophosphorylase